MSQSIQSRTTKPRGAMLAAVVMFALAGDIHAFAGESPSQTAPVPAKPEAVAAQTADAQKPTHHLLTREEMLNGMVEAERKRSQATRPDAAINNKEMLEKWGVQVLYVSYAADGFWLNFRFRVVEPEKAKVLFDSTIKPYLQSEVTGIKMAVPSAAKVGALRTTWRGPNVKPNKIYNIMFANPAFHVKPGEKVSVVAGDFKAEHLTVRGARENLSVRSATAETQTTVK